MTPDEIAEDMIRRGSVEVTYFGDLAVGDRVRHIGHRWPDAYRIGTGTIERIFHRPNSVWSRTHGRPNVELFVKKDDGSYSYLADYHVEVIES